MSHGHPSIRIMTLARSTCEILGFLGTDKLENTVGNVEKCVYAGITRRDGDTRTLPVLHCALRTPQREAESRRVYARRCTGDITRGARALTMALVRRS